MVSRRVINNKKYYICSQCGFVYEFKEMAIKCEKWCVENKSCNPEITKHSVEF